MYKKCWIFSIKKPTFFWVFLNKKCVSEKRSKTFENQIFFTKIAIEIAILSQEYSKIYRNFVAILRYNYRKNNLKISENCGKNCEFFITKGNAFCMGVTLLPEGPVYFLCLHLCIVNLIWSQPVFESICVTIDLTI